METGQSRRVHRALRRNGRAKQMATRLKTGRILARAACLAVLFAIVCTMGSAQRPHPAPLTITLAGQSMIRSDIRATAPAAGPGIQGLFKGDLGFTNFEAAMAE